MDDKKPKEYTFTKNVGPKFNLLPDAQPIDYFSSFFNYGLLNNTITKTNMYVSKKITKLRQRPRFICNKWSDV
jgi:hypothetical protein